MPVVPAPSLPSVAPSGTSGLPYGSAAGATPDAFGAAVGSAEEKLGGQIEKTSDMLAGHAIKMQEDINNTVANTMFVNAGIAAGKETEVLKQAQGLNAPGAYDQYVKNIEKIRNDALASAPNDDVKKKFDQEFRRRVGYSIEDGARYVGTQLKSANNASTVAVRATTLSDIAANANDDKRFEASIDTGLKTYRDMDDEFKGSTPEVKADKERAYVTAAWATRLQSMAKNDPLRARDLLNANKDKLDGGKVLQLQDGINQQIINVDTRVSSDKIVQSGALVPEELREAVKQFEGYKDTPYPDFKQVSSGYGTKAQPGDENIPPEQRKAVYEQRLTNELARAANIVDQFAPGLPSGTRSALISLTYNAGSAWTSSGLGQSIRAGDMEGARERFLQYNKAGGETNDALVNRRKAEADWFGGAATVSDPLSKLTTAMDAAKERAIQIFPDDPGNQARYLDSLQARIRSDHSVIETAARQMQLDQRNLVQKEIIGDPSVTSYDRLSAPAKQAYDQSPPSQQDVFNTGFKKNATSDVPLTSARQDLYDRLHGEAITPSTKDKFLSRNLTELDLPRAQISKLRALQDDTKALVEKGARSSSILSDSRSLLNDAGIRESATDKGANQEYMKFKGVLDQRVQQFIDEKKHLPSPEEGRALVKELTKEIVTSEHWYGDSKARGYNVVADPSIVVDLNADEPQKHFETLPRGARFRGPGDVNSRIKQ